MNLSYRTKARIPTKRSKTYSGCWTCRKRGMKCDELKPSCLRCVESRLTCAGYSLKLVWPGGTAAKGPRETQRRSMFDGSESNVVALSDVELDRVLDTLDEVNSDANIGPFTVFPIVASESDAGERSSSHSLKSHLTHVGGKMQCGSPWLMGAPLRKSSNETGCAVQTSGIILHNMSIPNVLDYHFKGNSIEERWLLHDWLTHKSCIILPVRDGAENPIMRIVYTMILSPPTLSSSTASKNALVHGICAAAAFNYVVLFPENHVYRRMAFRNYQLSLWYLRQSLNDSIASDRVVVLVAMLAIAIIGIVVGDSSDWRIHLAGARRWVKLQGSRFWDQSNDGSLIYQVFLFADGVGSLQRGLERSSQSSYEELVSEPLSSHYRLDALFGITQPLLDIITQVNKMAANLLPPSVAEVDELEIRIYRNKPSLDATEGPSIPYSETLQHAYYHACLIHLRRSLRRVPPREVEYLVQEIIRLITTAEQAQKSVELPAHDEVPYPVWPIFIAACEATEPVGRKILLAWLETGKWKGLGNMLAAASIAEEVWRRRDENPFTDVYWYDVMVDMKLDVLLL